MTRYERQLAEALAAVSVRGPARFAWMGRLEPGIDAPLEAAMDDPARRRYLVDALADRLRRSWYCHGRPIPARRAGGGAYVPDHALLGALSDANAGRGTFQSGWTVERLDGDVPVASDGMLRARVAPADVRPLDGALRPGAAIAVRLPKELQFYAPGFDYMLSDADLDAGAEQVRVYWHVTERGAVPLVRMLTAKLNAAGVVFEFKIATHPLELQRADAAVLYLPAAGFPPLREPLRALAAEAAPLLHPQVPALTLELAPGVGLAEGVRRAEGFGGRRCALIAEGVGRAYERGEAPLAAVAETFAEAGVSLDAPYREPALDGRHVL